MGSVRVPAGALYGASTQRAVENFPVSGRRFPRPFIRALGQIKMSAAKAGLRLGCLPSAIAKPVARAAAEVRDGRWDGQFVVDIFQTGSGTSTNMNANEVIANLANRYAGKGRRVRIHPNDHVNCCQSSNDVIPSAIHISVLLELRDALLPELRKLQYDLRAKAVSFRNITKIGRTHLQDATPMTLGQEFSGYSEQVRKAAARIESVFGRLRELPLGGTAVGTGINACPRFAREAIRDINHATGESFAEAKNHFEAQASKDTCVEVSGQLKAFAVTLTKIANDIRWLGSGPRGGLAEIRLPEVQPGSSIMPGKVNPVICEAVLQAAAEVIGSDTVVTYAAQSGNFELNTMMPLIAHHLLESIRLLAAAAKILTARCILGIRADRVRCQSLVEQSLMLATPLAKVIGYDAAARIAKEAYAKGETIREVLRRKKILPERKIAEILDVSKML